VEIELGFFLRVEFVAVHQPPYLSATSSGLTYLTERFKDFPNGVHIALQGVPRSILAEYAESHL
ncbi:hypothetical protein, partial [Klebsiella pneumoniae]|uniref:hypothetical protein n=1 Tax=Klebsiella pneumoniae TaxID=573 RepID=UPI002730F7BD